MLKKEFTYFIEKEKEGRYIKIPFVVPENIGKIIVEYDYPRYNEKSNDKETVFEEINIIDFGLYSNQDFLGASGSNRERIEISDKSDPGFSSIEIEAGTWHIMAGAYKIFSSGVNVTYTVTFIEKEWTLYKGDTHTHTVSSDGSYQYEELLQKAEKEGLDFLILSDHNNYTQNQQITGREPMTIIPGAEWTHYKGHANLIGVARPIIDPFIVKDSVEMKNLLHEAKENGALVSVNHPYCPFCGWTWNLDDTPFDLVEIYNGGLVPEANKQALDWWDKMLRSGKKITVTAGSDFHKVGGLRNLGQPCLGVWAHSGYKNELLRAMKKGHSYISFAVEGPSILLQAEDGIQGDTVSSKKVTVVLEQLKKGDKVVFLSDQGQEIWLVEKDLLQYKVEKENNGYHFYRVEIYRSPYSNSLQMPISLSNPIYFN